MRVLVADGLVEESLTRLGEVWDQDRPGMIGAVGTILGRHGVNIANMHVEKRAAPR